MDTWYALKWEMEQRHRDLSDISRQVRLEQWMDRRRRAGPMPVVYRVMAVGAPLVAALILLLTAK